MPSTAFQLASFSSPSATAPWGLRFRCAGRTAVDGGSTPVPAEREQGADDPVKETGGDIADVVHPPV